MTVETPHFSYPFRFETVPNTGDLAAVVVEQQSAEEVLDCVTRIAHTPRGFREELPDFGISDPTFSQVPVDAERMTDEIREWEPRTDLRGTASIDSIDELISIVRFDAEPEDRGEE